MEHHQHSTEPQSQQHVDNIEPRAMPSEGGISQQYQRHADVETIADVGYVGYDVAIRKVGNIEVAHHTDDGYNQHGGCVGNADIQPLLEIHRTAGKHHEGDGYQGHFLLQVEEGIVHIAGAEEPEQVDSQQD